MKLLGCFEVSTIESFPSFNLINLIFFLLDDGVADQSPLETQEEIEIDEILT